MLPPFWFTRGIVPLVTVPDVLTTATCPCGRAFPLCRMRMLTTSPGETEVIEPFACLVRFAGAVVKSWPPSPVQADAIQPLRQVQPVHELDALPPLARR